MSRVRFANTQYPELQTTTSQPWADVSTYPTSERTLREAFFIRCTDRIRSVSHLSHANYFSLVGLIAISKGVEIVVAPSGDPFPFHASRGKGG